MSHPRSEVQAGAPAGPASRTGRQAHAGRHHGARRVAPSMQLRAHGGDAGGLRVPLHGPRAHAPHALRGGNIRRAGGVGAIARGARGVAARSTSAQAREPSNRVRAGVPPCLKLRRDRNYDFTQCRWLASTIGLLFSPVGQSCNRSGALSGWWDTRGKRRAAIARARADTWVNLGRGGRPHRSPA